MLGLVSACVDPGDNTPPSAELSCYIKASKANAYDQFGGAVGMAGDGHTLVVGASNEDSVQRASGAAYMLGFGDDGWRHHELLKATAPESRDLLGTSVGISRDASTLAIGAPTDTTDTTATGKGAAYVFTRGILGWEEQAKLVASNASVKNGFGRALALSADGSTIAIGAVGESSAATGIDGNQAQGVAPYAGAVYVFTRSATGWSQQAYVKASNTDAGDRFGTSVALSADGNLLAVGAVYESSASPGIDGNQLDNSMYTGAVYLYARTNTAWKQIAYVKASNPSTGDMFGTHVTLSEDGTWLAVSAPNEASASPGIGGDQLDNSMLRAGAVYVYSATSAGWSQQAYIKASSVAVNAQFGTAIAFAANGQTLLVSAPRYGSPDPGVLYAFKRTDGVWSEVAGIPSPKPNVTFGDTVAASEDGSLVAIGAIGDPSALSGACQTPDQDISAPTSGAVWVMQVP